jgi:hypothetical protein
MSKQPRELKPGTKAFALRVNGHLDHENPCAKEDITHLLPPQLAADILKKERRTADILGNIQKLLHGV